MTTKGTLHFVHLLRADILLFAEFGQSGITGKMPSNSPNYEHGVARAAARKRLATTYYALQRSEDPIYLQITRVHMVIQSCSDHARNIQRCGAGEGLLEEDYFQAAKTFH